MTLSRHPLISRFVSTRHNVRVAEALAVVSGFLLLTMLAQIAMPLPFTPVPITGQTFGVAVIALLWGRKLGGLSVFCYVSGGFLGLPIFAGGVAGVFLGPTTGYFLGMVFASLVMGMLADRGWARTLPRAYLACAVGSIITFACGVSGLAFYLPGEMLFASGVLPFLPGDLLKSVAAALVAARTRPR